MNSTTFKRTLGIGAVALAVPGSAAGTWFNGAETALAPEPARLTANLMATTGAVAAAVYVSGAPTKVVRWGKDFVGGSDLPPAGQPCSTTALAEGTQTTMVIQAVGSQRRCV